MRETKIISCQSSTSMSSLISNATGYMKYFIESKFPENFFKKIHISGTLNEVLLNENELQKFSKPTLIIDPQYTGENGFMEQLPQWHNTQFFTFKNPNKRYNGVLYDETNNIYIYSIPDRVKVNFEIKIKLASQAQAYNTLHYLKQRFETNGYFYLNDVTLQTEVPNMFINYIARRLNLDLATADGRQAMDEYLLSHSYNGITEKINLSSGNSHYNYKYKTNILTNFPDIPSYEKNNNNMVVDSTTLSFSLSFDFWSHSNYVMEIKDNKPDLSMPVNNIENGEMKYDFYVPDTHFIKEQIDDKHMIVTKPFLPDINTNVDVLEFKPIINSELVTVIQAITEYKLDIDKLLDITVLINNKKLSKLNYDIDWKNLTLTTKDPMSNVTYTLIVYGNLKNLNLISELIVDGKRDSIRSLKF